MFRVLLRSSMNLTNIEHLDDEMLIHKEQNRVDLYQLNEILTFATVIVNREHSKRFHTNRLRINDLKKERLLNLK